MNPPTSSVHLQKLKTIEFMTREDFFKKYCSENPYKEQGRIEIHIKDNQELTEIPEYIGVCDVLHIDNCPNLCKLPDNLKVDFLFVSNCPKLTELPTDIDAALIEWDQARR
jgi:hypothetical protein